MKVQVESAIPLLITEEDLSPAVRAKAKAVRANDQILDSSEPATRSVIDALPAAIARRVRAIMPPDFDIKEMEIAFSVKGEIFGSGFGGDVKVKYAPKPKK